MIAVNEQSPVTRLLWLAHDVVAFVILAVAVVKFAALPQFPRAALMYFVPPILAFLFITLNTGKFNATVLYGCRLFLSMIAIAVLLAEIPFVLPNLKPQFAGLPQRQDRVLMFYFGAYILFIGVLCPGYVLLNALHCEIHRLPGRMARPILYGGLACWLIGLGFLAYGIAFGGKIF